MLDFVFRITMQYINVLLFQFQHCLYAAKHIYDYEILQLEIWNYMYINSLSGCGPLFGTTHL